MAEAGKQGVPQSPETQPADVRDQLHQDLTSHAGTERSSADAGDTPASHFGAVETEVTPNEPPMKGPADLVNRAGDDEQVFDPEDEITPG